MVPRWIAASTCCLPVSAEVCRQLWPVFDQRSEVRHQLKERAAETVGGRGCAVGLPADGGVQPRGRRESWFYGVSGRASRSVVGAVLAAVGPARSVGWVVGDGGGPFRP